MRTNTEVKCYLCGNKEKLRLIEFTEWVCPKDYERVMKFFKKIKGRKHTRYSSIDTFINGHGLKDENKV